MLSLVLTALLSTAPAESIQRLPSLKAAVNAADGTRQIVVYSKDVAAMRDNMVWLELERVLWASPALSEVMKAVPFVAYDSRHRDVKAMKLPSAGFTVLAADGKTRMAEIKILDHKLPQVFHQLAQALGKTVPADGLPDSLDPAKLKRAILRFKQYLKGGKIAEAKRFCRELESEDPGHSFIPGLRRQIRERETYDGWYEKLPGSRPIVSRIVIVPDRETFLAVISRWGEGPMFPILFHDTQYLPKFAKAFAAAEIVYAPRAKAKKSKPRQLSSTWAKALGLTGDAVIDQEQVLRQWYGLQDRTPGIVVVDRTGPMTCAGLALAAGRRQGLVFAERAEDPVPIIGMDTLRGWQERIRNPLEKAQLKAFDLYDEVDFVTLALELPYRYADPLACDKTSYAVDDAICRDTQGLRWAYTGRLCGTEIQSTYQAMCALFLQAKSSLLFSRYKQSGIWGEYGIDEADSWLSTTQKVTSVDHPDATRARWRELQTEGNHFDYVHINSSGGWRDWSTSGKKANFDDVPDSVPAIVSLTHSTSLGNPYSLDTIAGRWLHQGAYAYFGSVQEPYLDAFVPIGEVMERMIEGHEPIGSAFRHKAGTRRWRAWKLMQIGDPLLRFKQAIPEPIERASPPAKSQPKPRSASLKQAATRNPWRLGTAERKLFSWECQTIALQLEPSTKRAESLARAITKHLAKLDKRPKKYKDRERQALTSTLSALLRIGISNKTARVWAGSPTFRKLDSEALDMALHAACRSQLLSKDGAKLPYKALEDLAIRHACRAWSKQQLAAIQSLWREMFAARTTKKDDKPKLQKAIKSILGPSASKILS